MIMLPTYMWQYKYIISRRTEGVTYHHKKVSMHFFPPIIVYDWMWHPLFYYQTETHLDVTILPCQPQWDNWKHYDKLVKFMYYCIFFVGHPILVDSFSVLQFYTTTWYQVYHLYLLWERCNNFHLTTSIPSVSCITSGNVVSKWSIFSIVYFGIFLILVNFQCDTIWFQFYHMLRLWERFHHWTQATPSPIVSYVPRESMMSNLP